MFNFPTINFSGEVPITFRKGRQLVSCFQMDGSAINTVFLGENHAMFLKTVAFFRCVQGIQLVRVLVVCLAVKNKMKSQENMGYVGLNRTARCFQFIF